MIAVALAIKWDSPGPVFERQTRKGLGGRRFQTLKFRTTAHDPERTNPPWALKATALGQLLRYTRIDALPQLINVLRGEMTLIALDGKTPSFLD